MVTFAEHVQQKDAYVSELPLTHVTTWTSFADIVNSGCLNPSQCPRYKEPLVYFFYGKPAYRVKDANTVRHDTIYAPVCLIITPGTVTAGVKRVFPFDSGAGKDLLYHPEIDPADVDTYDLKSVTQAAQRLVVGFFSTNEKYWSGMLDMNLTIPPAGTPARKYYNLNNGGGDKDCDDRKSAVEYQVDQPIDLNGRIAAVALPHSFLENDDVKNVLSTWDAAPLAYELYKSFRPSEFHAHLRLLVRKHCEEKRWL
ncbi:MAG: hypothetical protein KKE37_08655 [Verrucomicrobia bacterium]|nr:hypothetical protein [Verrucomicrobiota bacterium]MBU4290161.1 hypothetical protein [Verrucomicrobiota bacterium]MBU4429406.1 hypothetical protein [Verrucomicrobiota bacterium]MCG2681435.1 hypothetical protein [Kiritimatiellia bacterium]